MNSLIHAKKLSKQAQHASKQNFSRNITIRLCRYSNAISLYITTILIRVEQQQFETIFELILCKQRCH